jgi:hypothetical protein
MSEVGAASERIQQQLHHLKAMELREAVLQLPRREEGLK